METCNLRNWKGKWSRQLAGDFMAGLVSATLISPIVIVIDRSVVERLASDGSLLRTLRTHAFCSILQPKRFYSSKPFFIVWSLYASTYVTANATDTCISQLPTMNESSTSASLTRTFSFLPTYAANVSLGILKDIRFAQAYGNTGHLPSTAPRVPRVAYLAFLIRDSITISSSFTLAPQVASFVPDWVTGDPHIKKTISQLALPALVQFVNTPLHLFALDLIARPHATTIAERSALIRSNWAQSSSVRAARVLPAFGIGVVINRELREVFQQRMIGG
ncbi:hypothetical protein BO71DRAFT_445342 [Aspergillus ellipticus CBS 707.79]|uniref:Sequence orphan n=1 Tax=Aspergillus ellipticus CBS 707.79 TaxID=1448320 RepID=A0A319D1B0_9EURO|nr:hypothetical protein BO71DRAFT_445342 [Aspergillus ellipticus CBS 707.79]